MLDLYIWYKYNQLNDVKIICNNNNKTINK